MHETVAVKCNAWTAGVDDGEAPPVPIPNTEVKLISVENTWRATAWEDRAVPTQIEKATRILRVAFLLFLCYNEFN